MVFSLHNTDNANCNIGFNLSVISWLSLLYHNIDLTIYYYGYTIYFRPFLVSSIRYPANLLAGYLAAGFIRANQYLSDIIYLGGIPRSPNAYFGPIMATAVSPTFMVFSNISSPGRICKSPNK